MGTRATETLDRVMAAILDLMKDEPYGWPVPRYADMCVSFDVSEGTVCTALKSLVKEEHLTKRGRTHLKGSPGQIAAMARSTLGRHLVGHLMEYRDGVECGAAKVAARRVKDGCRRWLPDFRSLLEKIDRARGTTRVAVLETLDWEIHDTLLRATENSVYCDLGAKLHIVLEGCVKANVRAMGHDPAYREATHEQHKKIITAIIHGVPELASQAVSIHLQYAMNRMGERRLARPV